MIPMHRKARPCPLPSRKTHVLQAVFRGTFLQRPGRAAAQTGAGAFFGRSLKKHGQTDGSPPLFCACRSVAKGRGFALPPCAAVTPQPPVPAPPAVRHREWSPCPARPRPTAVRRASGLRRGGTLPRRRGRFPPSPPCAGACPWPAQSGSAPAQGYAPGNRF